MEEIHWLGLLDSSFFLYSSWGILALSKIYGNTKSPPKWSPILRVTLYRCSPRRSCRYDTRLRILTLEASFIIVIKLEKLDTSQQRILFCSNVSLKKESFFQIATITRFRREKTILVCPPATCRQRRGRWRSRTQTSCGGSSFSFIQLFLLRLWRRRKQNLTFVHIFLSHRHLLVVTELCD